VVTCRVKSLTGIGVERRDLALGKEPDVVAVLFLDFFLLRVVLFGLGLGVVVLLVVLLVAAGEGGDDERQHKQQHAATPHEPLHG